VYAENVGGVALGGFRPISEILRSHPESLATNVNGPTTENEVEAPT
jgi:hypothetical protein